MNTDHKHCVYTFLCNVYTFLCSVYAFLCSLYTFLCSVNAFLYSVYAVFDTVHFQCNKSKLSSSTQAEDVEIGLFR